MPPKRKDHPGFAASARKIARKEGLPIEQADAIMASASRNASPAAKRANPNLDRVSDTSHIRKRVSRKFHPDMMLLSRPPRSEFDDMPPLEYVPEPAAPADDDVEMGTGLKRRRRCKTCGCLPKRGKGSDSLTNITSAMKSDPDWRSKLPKQIKGKRSSARASPALLEAIARDNVHQKDKMSASMLRDAAMANAKSRGGNLGIKIGTWSL